MEKVRYIHANQSTFPIMTISGPDTIKLISYISVNSYKRFPIRSAKHMIKCNDNGNVVIHGIVLRTDEEKVVIYSDPFYITYVAEKGNYNVTTEVYTELKNYMFQLAGLVLLKLLNRQLRRIFTISNLCVFAVQL